MNRKQIETIGAVLAGSGIQSKQHQGPVALWHQLGVCITIVLM